MPTDKNVPPLDSFESDGAAFAQEKHVGMKDGHLDSMFNPPKGKDRVSCEQYDTHTWAPGTSGTRKSGCSPLEAGIRSEQFGVVKSKLA